MPAKDYNKNTPLDSRLLLSRQVTGAGGDDAAPTAALASTEYVETMDLTSVRVYAYGDDATGAGNVFTVVPWHYQRSVGRDPLAPLTVGNPAWHQGKAVQVTLGYDDTDANKGFLFDTQGAERMHFQVINIPGALVFGRTDIYVEATRKEVMPVHVASGFLSALNTFFKVTASGGLAVDTELTLDATNVFINNAFSFAKTPADATTSGFALMNANNRVETDLVQLGTNAITLGAGVVAAGTQRVTLADDDVHFSHLSEKTVLENIAVGITHYYFDMTEFRHFSIMLDFSAALGVGVTIWATVQDDGTAAAACFYLDRTTPWFGVANVNADDMLERDTVATLHYFRVTVDNTGGAGTEDLTIYTKMMW